MQVEREDYVCDKDGGCGRSGAPLIWSSGREAGGGRTAGSPPGEHAHRTPGMPIVFHTATRTPPDDTAQRARPRQFTHLHTRLPVCLCSGLLAFVPATHACLHGTRVAWRHVYCFSIWMTNVAALLLNRSMARIHCWSNAHGPNK